MRRCPDCKSDISNSASACPICGCDIVLRQQEAEETRLAKCRMNGVDPNSMEGQMIMFGPYFKDPKGNPDPFGIKAEKEKERKKKLKKKKEQERWKKRIEETDRAEAKKKGLTYDEYRKQKDAKFGIYFITFVIIMIYLSYC